MITINDAPLSVTMFPDNTSQVWKLDEKLLNAKFARVKWIFEKESEFLHLAQLKELLDAYNMLAYLTIEYLPYARQDKPVANNATFALITFAKLLNSLNFKTVTVLDPHSNRASECVSNILLNYPIAQLQNTIKETYSDLICYPDKGALNKYVEEYQFELLPPYIYAEKTRDPLTGNIINYELIGSPKDKNVIIVDDICDGGMTFKLLAIKLLELGAKQITLFVTHGIYSKGLKTLFDSGISRIFDKTGEKLYEKP